MNSSKEICLSDKVQDMVWRSDHPEKHALLPETDISLHFLEESVELVCCGMQFKCNCLNQSLETLKKKTNIIGSKFLVVRMVLHSRSHIQSIASTL